MELTLREFENLNLYSNKNMEKVISKLINESSNAALVNMFDDSLVLLDHDEGKFYTADYKFDDEKLRLHLENFEEVQLVKEEDDFREEVSSFFDDDEADASKLTESYKDNVLEQEKYINELISDAMSVKDFSDYADYKKIKEAKEDLKLESVNEDFYKKYQERLESHPLTEVKYIDWENPITVSLMETEKKTIINSSVAERAKDLWKKADFKKRFIEAVEEGEEAILELFEEFPSLFYLSEEDRNALFGKSLIASPSLREKRKEVIDEINDLLENNEDLVTLKEKYISEEDDEEGDGEDDEEGEEEEESPVELSAAQAKKMVADLEKVKDAVEDEELGSKIDAIIADLEDTEEEGTKPAAVKEAVAILSM